MADLNSAIWRIAFWLKDDMVPSFSTMRPLFWSDSLWLQASSGLQFPSARTAKSTNLSFFFPEHGMPRCVKIFFFNSSTRIAWNLPWLLSSAIFKNSMLTRKLEIGLSGLDVCGAMYCEMRKLHYGIFKKKGGGLTCYYKINYCYRLQLVKGLCVLKQS